MFEAGRRRCLICLPSGFEPKRREMLSTKTIVVKFNYASSFPVSFLSWRLQPRCDWLKVVVKAVASIRKNYSSTDQHWVAWGHFQSVFGLLRLHGLFPFEFLFPMSKRRFEDIYSSILPRKWQRWRGPSFSVLVPRLKRRRKHLLPTEKLYSVIKRSEVLSKPTFCFTGKCRLCAQTAWKHFRKTMFHSNVSSFIVWGAVITI